jgi:hypothetical protein
LRERDRTSLFGIQLGMLRGNREPLLHRVATIRRQRSVGQRRQIGDVLASSSLSPPQSHCGLNRSSLPGAFMSSKTPR